MFSKPSKTERKQIQNVIRNFGVVNKLAEFKHIGRFNYSTELMRDIYYPKCILKVQPPNIVLYSYPERSPWNRSNRELQIRLLWCTKKEDSFNGEVPVSFSNKQQSNYLVSLRITTLHVIFRYNIK